MKSLKRHHRWSSVVIIWLVVALPSIATAAAKAEQLRQTMADIALLNSQLAQRKADADEIRQALTAQMETIKAEAWRQLQEKQIKSEATALKTPRLLYDLMLIAETQAYIDRYAQKSGYYRVACDRLSYLYQQADDDLKIVNTLSGMKIEALISQAGKILDAYLPDAQTLVIQPDNLATDSPEKVWRALTSGQ